jgi:hypothetical protein
MLKNLSCNVYDVGKNDTILNCDCGSTNLVINLPNDISNREVTIKKVDNSTNTITILPNNIILTTIDDYVTIEASSQGWIVTDRSSGIFGSNTLWVDVDFPIIIRTTGASIPTLATLTGNITAPSWGINDVNICEGQELIHAWKEGSRVYWHCHIITNGTNTDNRFVKFEIEYTWCSVSGQLATADTQSGEITIPANTPDRTMIILPIYNFIPTNGKIGGHVYARLKRITASGTAPTGNPFCTMLQLHIECDTAGSRQMTIK